MNASPKPFSGNDADQNSCSRGLPTDGSFDVSFNAGWLAKRAMQLNPEIEPNVRATLRGLVGNEFTPQEIQTLETRAFDNVEHSDLPALAGIHAGVPVQLNGLQARKIEGLLGRLGNDPLNQRARDAYAKGIKNGKIKIR